MTCRFTLPILLSLLAACATPRIQQRPVLREEAPAVQALVTPWPQLVVEDDSEEWSHWPTLGERVASRVARWVGLSSLRAVSRSVPDDCSGLVRLALGMEGVALTRVSVSQGESLAKAIHRRAVEIGAARDEGQPQPGDLIFFRDTYDRNRDGRLNDGLTHVGVVEGVDEQGTVTFIHRGHKGVRRARMNLNHADQHVDEQGSVLNDYLRRSGRATSLSSLLFAGYAVPDANW